MGEDQLESQLAGLFSDFVAPEPDPRPALGGPLSALEPQAGLGAKGGSRRVVVLHSHLESARLLSGFFKKDGDRVWQAADLAEARSLLERNGPGLLVTDRGAPDDGWLAELGELRGRFAGTKVVATDGYPAPQPNATRALATPRGSLSGVRMAPAAGVAAGAAELRSYRA